MAMQMLALVGAVAEFEIPVGRDLRGGREQPLPGGLDDVLALYVGAGEDARPAVAAFQPEFAFEEFRDGFVGLGGGCHKGLKSLSKQADFIVASFKSSQNANFID